MSDPALLPRHVALWAACLAGIGAVVLSSLGRPESALALTLGAVVAIVSALWLAEVVSHLAASGGGESARLDWKLGLKTVLRYIAMGGVLFGAVRLLPGDVAWLLAGVSTVVLAVGIVGTADLVRGAKRESP